MMHDRELRHYFYHYYYNLFNTRVRTIMCVCVLVMSDSLRSQRLQAARLLCTLRQHHLIVIIPLLSLHHHPLHSSQTANRI